MKREKMGLWTAIAVGVGTAMMVAMDQSAAGFAMGMGGTLLLAAVLARLTKPTE